jgi:hypothetical protein
MMETIYNTAKLATNISDKVRQLDKEQVRGVNEKRSYANLFVDRQGPNKPLLMWKMSRN